MPYYLFQVTLVDKNRRGKYTGFASKEAIRHDGTPDIDLVWRKYHAKFTEHYGYLMTGFSVVMLSKFDPRVISHIRLTKQNPEEDWWTVIKGGKSPDDEEDIRS